MLQHTSVLLRRGKPRPRAGMFPDKYRRVPTLLKPQQGGQQYFSEFLIQRANEEAMQNVGRYTSPTDPGAQVNPRLPQADVNHMMRQTKEEVIQQEMASLVAHDGFNSQRTFNERMWYEQEVEKMQASSTGTVTAVETDVPERVLGEDYFRSRYGYSLLKKEDGPSSGMRNTITDYAQLDLWGEMPKYTRDMVFLYLVSRRRNTYAVAYDYDGKRLLTTYTAGNRGLKGGDRGFRGDGSTENGHQVTSMYLNDLLPKIRERRSAAGRPMAKSEKVELVVRVMGFYNGRQGAVRAVQDRSNEFIVRYLEDITPFPLNGPKMPRGVFR